MTLRTFMVRCRSSPDLAELWEKLFGAVHHVLNERLNERPNTENLAKFEKEYGERRALLEASCKERGIEYPDLSLQEFANHMIRYRSRLARRTA